MIEQDYLALGCIALAFWWVGGSLAVMVAAGRRGYSSGHWLLAGVIFGPILAALLLLANPKEAAVRRTDTIHI